ncbi:PepSY domain-containing protein [Elizabethkingia anophelis]|uniref:PepSY domain-containing protein n=1 Tax=Elizabethkingia anophelis TaxID=1117645 RepID=UPI00200CD0E3|nr:PepSY domain-containing protein [Elizabethkingia anophelis]MCL1033846.1 PepSY domain-containing protein [Elizabethkingia anophelis]MCW2464579.1 sulfite reductase (NADPH) flavoprotein alpha-component [Elizabethkingia anophelis]MCW2468262.1 sulfite reductase (NADPH) flavoprotein alpha-component [Elizabethkingia anophelis]MCW2471946.1 sulfite reductase (NADPH) flavoprotein alpha-component [Elizabethkingia anophelis]HBI9691708.1 PepSY domain-containing protein [Elizabethkingia anophelis]
MTLSIWRYAHLTLAILTFSFLIVASSTGVILAYDAAQEKVQPYRVDDFSELNLAQSLPELRKVFPEITEITVDHNQFVTLEGFDQEGKEVKAYINPKTGKILGKPIEKSEFINWVTSLHRSLFLKETGRFAVGIISFLLMLISISGLILIIKRQQGVKHFFDKIKKDFFSQYFHVVSGRLLLIPVLVIAITGTYLFMIRFEFIPKGKNENVVIKKNNDESEKKIAEFPIFKETNFNNVKKIEFPFIEDEPEEYFVLKLKDREISVNQINGNIVKEEKYPLTTIYDNLSLSLHTGRGSVTWAIILGLASLNILMFIYSGFVITFKRTRNKIRNKHKAEDAEIVILVGSENGSTLGFASHIHSQFNSAGKKSFLTELNHYKVFPKAQHILVFTSTYGLGDAPTNAKHFKNLLPKFPQNQKVKYSVVGFGSKAYDDFCGYAIEIDQLLGEQNWAEPQLALHTVNDRSTTEFAEWAKQWSYETMIPLASAPSLYNQKTPPLKPMKVVGKSEIVEEVTTFKILLKPGRTLSFKSGDLLAIYPDNDHKERFYSIGKVDGAIQLVVKLYENGLGSGFLYKLKEGQEIKARIVKNSEFHLPKKANKVAMISNGTGIAPFLGMIEENSKETEAHLYCGFRRSSKLTKSYEDFAAENIQKGKLTKLNLAYSREEQSQYVMDLVKRDAIFFIDLLTQGGYIMICGALKMQHDLEDLLRDLCTQQNKNYEDYKANGQILTDCY